VIHPRKERKKVQKLISKHDRETDRERIQISLTLPMASNREELKEAAVRMGMGKLVAPGTTLEK